MECKFMTRDQMQTHDSDWMQTHNECKLLVMIWTECKVLNDKIEWKHKTENWVSTTCNGWLNADLFRRTPFSPLPCSVIILSLNTLVWRNWMIRGIPHTLEQYNSSEYINQGLFITCYSNVFKDVPMVYSWSLSVKPALKTTCIKGPPAYKDIL